MEMLEGLASEGQLLGGISPADDQGDVQKGSCPLRRRSEIAAGIVGSGPGIFDLLLDADVCVFRRRSIQCVGTACRKGYSQVGVVPANCVSHFRRNGTLRAPAMPR